MNAQPSNEGRFLDRHVMENNFDFVEMHLLSLGGRMIEYEHVPPGIGNFDSMYLLLKANWSIAKGLLSIDEIINVCDTAILVLFAWLCDVNDFSYESSRAMYRDLIAERILDTPLIDRVEAFVNAHKSN